MVRGGNIAFVNVSRRFSDKAAKVVRALRDSPEISSYLDDLNLTCEIVLKEGMLAAPAMISYKDGRITIKLAAFYFQDYEIGYVVGMMAHELGIHTVPNSRHVPLVENRDAKRSEPKLFKGKIQPDHILGARPTTERHSIYKEVALSMGQALLQEAQRAEYEASARQTTAKGKRRATPPGGRDVRDLLDCFFMDVASIAATNDSRLKGLYRGDVREQIATLYNQYKDRLRQELSDETHPFGHFTPFLPVDKTPEAVREDYRLYARRAFGTGLGNATKSVLTAGLYSSPSRTSRMSLRD